MLAQVEMNYGWDFTAANQHLERALALNPGDATILKLAAGLSRRLGRLDEAAALYDQLRVWCDEDRLLEGAVALRVYYAAGLLYEQSGDNDKAVAAYEEFLAMWGELDFPEVEDARLRLERLRQGS